MTKEERTQTILDRERKQPNEWDRLHAVVCLSLDWPCEDAIKLREFFDAGAIAGRCDEIIRDEAKV